MPTHWTYVDFAPNCDLEQGDILQPTDELRLLFREVHPHFCDEKYLGFMIVSQTCDLVRRKGEPKTQYISLAVIRPLYQIQRKLISQVVKPVAEGKFLASRKADARFLFERIVNQNEQSQGLFFLYPDADAGIGEHAISLLRVTVTVKSEHYTKLLNARTGRKRSTNPILT